MYELHIPFPKGDLKVKLDIFIIDIYLLVAKAEAFWKSVLR